VIQSEKLIDETHLNKGFIGIQELKQTTSKNCYVYSLFKV